MEGDKEVGMAEWVNEALMRHHSVYQARSRYVETGEPEDFNAMGAAIKAFIEHLWSEQP